jgi:hypothetical protein
VKLVHPQEDVAGAAHDARVPVARTAAGAGQDAVLELATSIIERDGSLTTSELAKAGDVSVRTGQRWVRSLLESGRLKASADDAKRYVLAGGRSDTQAT